MAAGTYLVRIKDSIDSKIAMKLTQIAQAASGAGTSAGKFAEQMYKAGASQRAVAGQRNLARSFNTVTVSCNKTTVALKKNETQHVRAALAARKYEVAMQKVKAMNYGVVQSGARMIGMISRYTALLGIAFNVHKLIEVGDAFTALENKLKAVTTTADNLGKVTHEVFEVAQRSRVSVDAVAKSYVRFDLALQQLGKSQADSMRLTETINKMLIVGGANSEEAAAGLLQLSQAFNKGKLDGDEFRSVMELMPKAADAIAKELGVTRGELLKLAPEGKITAEVMSRAFESVAGDIDKAFDKTIPTIKQSLTVMKNEMTRAFGEFDKASGFTQSISKAIISLSKNLDTVGKVAASVGAVFATFFGLKLLGMITNLSGAVTGLWGLMAANPFGAVALAIAAAVGALVYFSDEIIVNQDSMLTLRDYAVATWELITENAKYMVEAIKMAVRDLMVELEKFWADHGIEIKAIAQAFYETWATVLKFIVNNTIGGTKNILAIWDKTAVLLDGIFFAFADAAISYIEEIANAFTGLFNMIDKGGKLFEIVGEATGVNQISALGRGMNAIPQFEFTRPERGILGTTREGVDVGTGQLQKELIDNISQDYLGDFSKDLQMVLKETLGPIGEAINERALKNYADKVFREMNYGMNSDGYYDARPVPGGPNSGSVDKKGSSSKKIRQGLVQGFEAQAQNLGDSCGRATVASIINNFKGTKLVDFDIPSGSSTLGEINRGLPRNVRYEDYGNITDEGMIERIAQAIEKGFPVAFAANGGQFSSGAGHIMAMTGFKGTGLEDYFSYMDPADGTMQNAKWKTLLNASKHPDGNFVMGPTDIANRAPRHKQETKFLEAENAKKIAEALADAKMHMSAVVSGAKMLNAELQRLDKVDQAHEQFVNDLEKEAMLLRMSSEEAEDLVGYYDYADKFEDAFKLMSEEDYLRLVKANREAAIMQDYQKQALDNSRAALDLDIQRRIAALDQPGITKEDKFNESVSILEDRGFDMGFLEEQYSYRLQLEKDFRAEVSRLVKEGTLEQKQAADIIAGYEKDQAEMKLEVWSGFFGNMASLQRSKVKEIAMVGKAAAIAQAMIDTYAAATKALATYPPPFGKIAAAGIVVAGLANVAQIRAQNPGFKQGGFTGSGNPNDVAGVVHKGEFVMDAQTTARLGVGNLQNLQDGSNIKQSSNQQGPPVVVQSAPPNVIVVSSREEAMMAMSGREGETIFMNHIENNSTAVARMLS